MNPPPTPSTSAPPLADRKKVTTPDSLLLRFLKSAWMRLRSSSPPKEPPAPPEQWPLHQPLLQWSKRDAHTIGSAVTGTFVCGMTGSGKTQYVGYEIALSYLKAGFSFVVFCVKSDEPQFWLDLAAKSGRRDDALLFDHPDKSPLRFNFLQYEAERPGYGAGITENLVRTFAEVSEITSRRAGQQNTHGDAFWQESVDGLVRNAVDLCLLAGASLSAETLHQLVLSAPGSLDEVRSASWRERSLCWHLLIQAAQRELTARQKHDLEVVSDYFLHVYADMAGRTKSVVVASFTNMTDVLSRGLLCELFGGESTVTPDVLNSGRILVIALPIKEYGPLGTMAAAIWKAAVQRWAERRDVSANPRPVCLWMDEAQHLVTRNDALVASTCRSSRVALVMMTQTIGSLHVALGGGEAGKAETDALTANLVTKVFTANGDPTTNEFAATLIGRAPRAFVNASSSYQPQSWLSHSAGLSVEPSTTAGISESMDYIVNPAHFGTLRTGGESNNGCVDAIVVRNGRVFQGSGSVYLPVTFRRDH